ncbi:hypothetical protein WG219_20510 [Ectopseudomonas mendocina]|uniref:Lipoprotein n=1 Tax=Ectopseudomonas mendocina TaxID=300 RepID=A0ABZ2RF58_ECTME
MYRLLPALLASLMLVGCASSPKDPSGVWINQTAIDAAVSNGNLHEALLAYGPNLEWQIDLAHQRASVSNGYQQYEGQLTREADGQYRAIFNTDIQESLKVSSGKLIQAASDTWPEQHFNAAKQSAPNIGGTFIQALYTAYMGGTWEIKEGIGRGGLVQFAADGSVKGLPGAERYALCLGGDCAAMNGDSDGIWLQLGNQGDSWLFEREGSDMRVYEAINQAPAGEIASYRKGPQRWKLVLR